MIKKILIFFSFVLVVSCGNIELILKESNSGNLLKNNVLVIISEGKTVEYAGGLFSFFGSNNNGDYILITSLVEKKENKIVKKNQVAEKIDYELIVDYQLFYKNRDCKILENKTITKFSHSPKSFGYNFGADRSLKKQYSSSIKKNIEKFILLVPISTECIK